MLWFFYMFLNVKILLGHKPLMNATACNDLNFEYIAMDGRFACIHIRKLKSNYPIGKNEEEIHQKKMVIDVGLQHIFYINFRQNRCFVCIPSSLSVNQSLALLISAVEFRFSANFYQKKKTKRSAMPLIVLDVIWAIALHWLTFITKILIS